MKDKLLKLKDQVLFCLQTWEHTRNCDKALFIKVLREFYDAPDLISVNSIYSYPSFDTISRWRRKIQQHGEYPPTSWEVAQQRGWMQDEWKGALGYAVAPDGQTEMVF